MLPVTPAALLEVSGSYIPGPEAIFPEMLLSATKYWPAVLQFEFKAVFPDPEMMAAIIAGRLSGLLLYVKASQTLTVTYIVVPGEGLFVDSPRILTVGLWEKTNEGKKTNKTKRVERRSLITVNQALIKSP